MALNTREEPPRLARGPRAGRQQGCLAPGQVLPMLSSSELTSGTEVLEQGLADGATVRATLVPPRGCSVSSIRKETGRKEREK